MQRFFRFVFFLTRAGISQTGLQGRFFKSGKGSSDGLLPVVRLLRSLSGVPPPGDAGTEALDIQAGRGGRARVRDEPPVP